MNSYFLSDYRRMTGEEYKCGFKSYFKIHLSHNLLYIYLFRKYQKKPSILLKFRLHSIAKRYGLEISPDANIGEGVYLGHAYGITINSGAIIGKNCNFHKGCTIGRENRGKRIGAPALGDDVYVGINATICGSIKIGDDVLIAPNSFVNFDVPSHSVVIGNPATIHPKEDATAGYIAFKIGRKE